MFKAASESVLHEREKRKGMRAQMRAFGIKFLDDALLGILPQDLVLIGAPSGIGKTQLCCNIALKNLYAGKRIHFLALEAEDYEIERRLKYQLVAEQFFKDTARPKIDRLSYDRWYLGDYFDQLSEYESNAEIFMSAAYKNLFIYYKESEFTVANLTENIIRAAPDTDLFIVDHAHYFDFDDDNENRGMKKLAKTIRDLVLEEKKPVVLVAHLRKRDRANEELVPGIDEFHGSSDLTKIATRVVTMAPGARAEDGTYETFFRVPKNRFNGGTNRFIGRVFFDPRRNEYEPRYKIGSATLTRKGGFEELGEGFRPEWAGVFDWT